MKVLRSVAAIVPGLLFACATGGPITRVADGESFESRAIAPEAYAAYLRASVLEARGDARGAVTELERALDEDPNSPEIVTRIACILCASGGDSKEASNEALGSFDDALALDPSYAPAWLGLAECRERRRDLAGALDAAERAVYFDASSAAATRTAARLAFALGRPLEAWTLLEALVALFPESREALEAYFDAATTRSDAPREARARRALSKLGVASKRSRAEALDDALRAGDLPGARALAVHLSLAPSALAWRALELSERDLALEQAALVLAADPSDSDAWLAALAASDELGDDGRFVETLRALDSEPLPPSPRALVVLETLVVRHAGPEAAAAFRAAQRNP
ncbi:MAG TPA: tetratricopeptide repeat protein [Polyangiaceae bacterium]|nr:tetratricopeptide repeat protein [Polyangiaceae bacterium]